MNDKAMKYKMVLEYDTEDRVWFIRFPELPGCLSHGKTPQEALAMGLKARDEWLEATHERGWPIPLPWEQEKGGEDERNRHDRP